LLRSELAAAYEAQGAEIATSQAERASLRSGVDELQRSLARQKAELQEALRAAQAAAEPILIAPNCKQ
jgi:hypothetical protein